jgi:hypothetical protein
MCGSIIFLRKKIIKLHLKKVTIFFFKYYYSPSNKSARGVREIYLLKVSGWCFHVNQADANLFSITSSSTFCSLKIKIQKQMCNTFGLLLVDQAAWVYLQKKINKKEAS